jgi:uncharacterized protein (TIGR02246 family)
VATTTSTEVYVAVRDIIARHAQAQDDGRTDDMVALYCDDAVLEVPGMGVYEGVEAIRAAWDGWKPQSPQRHVVVNTVLTDWSDSDASATSDVVYVQKGDAGWSVQIVCRYKDVFQRRQGRWLLRRRADEYVAWEPPTSAS